MIYCFIYFILPVLPLTIIRAENSKVKCSTIGDKSNLYLILVFL